MKAPENRSQGNWLKELRQFCLEEKKVREQDTKGCCVEERAHLTSVALRTQLGPKGGWKVIQALGSERFQVIIKAAQLEGSAN